MKIMLGPKTNDADKLIVKALIDKYQPRIQMQESSLKGKIRT